MRRLARLPPAFSHSHPPFPRYCPLSTPWAVYDKRQNLFVLYFNAYIHGCCEGNWGVATSADGIHFDILSMDVHGKYAEVDCNSVFVDDDGAGYLLYTSEAQDHTHSIEVLSSNLTALAGTNLGLFGPRYTEGGMLFKHGSTYYAAMGSCCCFCKGGSGWVVHSAQNIAGPWVRQPFDLNCNSTDPAAICGAYGDRNGDPIIIKAQGIGMSTGIPLADGTTAILWHGERFLSAPFSNPTCPDECQPQVAPNCAQDKRYVKGDGFSYTIPIEFNDDTTIKPFRPFVDSFQLDIAESFGVAHLR